MSLLRERIQRNVDALDKAGALALVFLKADVALHDSHISLEPNSGYGEDLFDCDAEAAGHIPRQRSCGNLSQRADYCSSLDPFSSRRSSPEDSGMPPALAILAAKGLEEFLSHGWKMASELICEADALYRERHHIVESPLDLLQANARPSSPLAKISPSDLASFSDCRDASLGATAERRRLFDRARLYEDLAECFSAKISEMASSKQLTHAKIEVFRNVKDGGVRILSRHFIAENMACQRIPEWHRELCLQATANPLVLDPSQAAALAAESAMLASLGRAAYIDRAWRAVEQDILKAGADIRDAFDLPLPAGLATLLERDELSALVPEAPCAPSRPRGPL